MVLTNITFLVILCKNVEIIEGIVKACSTQPFINKTLRKSYKRKGIKHMKKKTGRIAAVIIAITAAASAIIYKIKHLEK